DTPRAASVIAAMAPAGPPPTTTTSAPGLTAHAPGATRATPARPPSLARGRARTPRSRRGRPAGSPRQGPPGRGPRPRRRGRDPTPGTRGSRPRQAGQGDSDRCRAPRHAPGAPCTGTILGRGRVQCAHARVPPDRPPVVRGDLQRGDAPAARRLGGDRLATRHPDRRPDGLGQDARRVPLGARPPPPPRARAAAGGPRVRGLRLTAPRPEQRHREEPPRAARGAPGESGGR